MLHKQVGIKRLNSRMNFYLKGGKVALWWYFMVYEVFSKYRPPGRKNQRSFGETLETTT